MVSYNHKAPLPDPGGQCKGRHREHSGRKDEYMKRTHQRFLSLLLALVMVFGLISPASAAEVIDVEVYVDRQHGRHRQHQRLLRGL